MESEGIDALLDLPGFRVMDHVIRPHELERHLARRDTSLVCPRCQGYCERIKDRSVRCLRDVPMSERPVTLRLHVRRFKGSDCPHRPWEQRETCGDRMHWTDRLSDPVRQECLHGCPCQELARRDGLSARTVFRWPLARSRGGHPRQLGRARGLDAYARRKGHRWNTIIVDADNGRPLTTVKGRRVEDVVAWLQSRPHAERGGVEGVGVEMFTSFDAAMAQVFGDQGEVLDRFHGVQHAVGALDAVWRSGQKHLPPEEAKARTKLGTRWLK
jgi:transposase